MTLAWYVARTRPLAEYRARDYLKAKGIEGFLATVSTPSPRRGGEDAPLFPGYLFARYKLQEWGTVPLLLGQGLAGLVTFDGVAPSVPDEVIDELKQRVADINDSGGLWRRYRSGDRVLVCLGSQESESLAEVVEGAKSPQGRVRVLLEFLGRLAHAEVPHRNIRLAWEHEASMKTLARLCPGEAHPEDTHRWSRRGTRGRGRHFRSGGSDNGVL